MTAVPLDPLENVWGVMLYTDDTIQAVPLEPERAVDWDDMLCLIHGRVHGAWHLTVRDVLCKLAPHLIPSAAAAAVWVAKQCAIRDGEHVAVAMSHRRLRKESETVRNTFHAPPSVDVSLVALPYDADTTDMPAEDARIRTAVIVRVGYTDHKDVVAWARKRYPGLCHMIILDDGNDAGKIPEAQRVII